MWRREAPRSSCILMYKESFPFYHFVKLKFELIPYNSLYRHFEKQLNEPKFKSGLLDYYQLQYAIQVAHSHDTVIVLHARITLSQLYQALSSLAKPPMITAKDYSVSVETPTHALPTRGFPEADHHWT